MNTLKILHLEDESTDAELVQRTLANAGFTSTITLATNRKEYEDVIQEMKPDVILSDHSMRQFDSLDALSIYKNAGLDVPFILVTGTVSEEFAVRILKEGAADYLLKDNLARLPNAILTAVKNYHLRKEYQDNLKELIAREALLSEAEHVGEFGSWQVDLLSGELKMSDECYRIWGYEPGELSLKTLKYFLKHIHPDDLQKVQDALSDEWRREVYELETRVIDNNGKTKHLGIKVTVKKDDAGRPVSLIGITRDISQKKETEALLVQNLRDMAELEKKLLKQKLTQQRSITEATIQAQEKERNEIGKELHDNINQILASVKLYLEIAIVNQKDSTDEILPMCKRNVELAIKEIRKLSHDLIPPSLGDHGLVDSIGEMVSELNTAGKFLTVLSVTSFNEGKLDSSKKIMLYRIIQEQVSNIIRYSEATNVRITLDSDDRTVMLSVADNGIGFDTSKKAKGIGLKNIENRVSYYGGRLSVHSEPGKGTVLEVVLPVESSE